jgi:hypothetical protein
VAPNVPLYQFWIALVELRNEFCVRFVFFRVSVYRVPRPAAEFERRRICGPRWRYPHRFTHPTRFYKWMVAYVLAIVSMPLWLNGPSWNDANPVWFARLLSLSAQIGMIWWATFGHRQSAPPKS